MKKSLLTVFSFALVASGCGSDESTSSYRKDSYRYDFQVSSCQPASFKGRFSSLEEMCLALSYQANLYPCASQQILRAMDDKDCHRGDFLQSSNAHFQNSSGVFYNVDDQRYLLTPEGSIRLEHPQEGLPEGTAYENGPLLMAQTEDLSVEDYERIFTTPDGAKVDLSDRRGKSPKAEEDLTVEDYERMYTTPDNVTGINPNPNSGLVTPDGINSTTRETMDSKKPPRKETAQNTKDSEPVTRTADLPDSAPLPKPRPNNSESKPVEKKPTVVKPEPKPVPDTRPLPKPAPIKDEVSEEAPPQEDSQVPTEEPLVEVKETKPEIKESSPAHSSEKEEAVAQEEKPQDQTSATSEESVDVTAAEDISDVSSEILPNKFNLIYFSPNGALYSEIPSPQSQLRFPILKVTAKIDSRSPINGKRHSNPISDLQTEILTPESSLCKVVSNISSQGDILVLTLKVKDQTDASMIQACKEWMRSLRDQNFEISTPDLKTDKGDIVGQFNFVVGP